MVLPQTLSESDQALLRACNERDMAALKRALRDGARLNGMIPFPSANSGEKPSPDAGKQPVHIAVKTGFVDGLALLVRLGADRDVAEKGEFGNTPLMLSEGQPDAFNHLLAVGADIEKTNNRGYSARRVARMPAPGVPSNRKMTIQQSMIAVFDAVPGEKDFSALTREKLFERNRKSLCLMDNPLILRQIDKVLPAAARNHAGISLSDLMQSVPDKAAYLMPENMTAVRNLLEKGVLVHQVADRVKPPRRTVTYLERIAQTAAFEPMVRGFNATGIGLCKDALLAPDGAPSELLSLAIGHQQLQPFFTTSNWAGQRAEDLRAVYHAIPKEERWQISNYHRLDAALQAANSGRGTGRGR